MINSIILLVDRGFVRVKQGHFKDVYRLGWHIQDVECSIINEYAIQIDEGHSVQKVVYVMQQRMHKALRDLCLRELRMVYTVESLETLGVYSRDMTLNELVRVTLVNLHNDSRAKYDIRELHACPLIHMSQEEVNRLYSGLRMSDSCVLSIETGRPVETYREAAYLLSKELDQDQVKSCLAYLVEASIL